LLLSSPILSMKKEANPEKNKAKPGYPFHRRRVKESIAKTYFS